MNLCLILFYLQKKRLSLITAGGDGESLQNSGNSGGPSVMQGSFIINNHTRFSPQNSFGPSSLPGVPHTPTGTSASSRPQTPGSNSNERSTTPSSPLDGGPRSLKSEMSSSSLSSKMAASAIAGAHHQLDRTNDAVYGATTSVVKTIMTLSQGVEKAIAVEYLDLVKNVGLELRNLLGSVDALSGSFPQQAHKFVTTIMFCTIFY